MAGNDEEDQRTYSPCVTKKKNNDIEIKCLRGNTVPIIITNLCEACSNDAVNCSTVARWFQWFQEGRGSMEDNVRTGRPSTTTDNTLIVIEFTLIDEDRQMMVREMEGESGISKRTNTSL